MGSVGTGEHKADSSGNAGGSVLRASILHYTTEGGWADIPCENIGSQGVVDVIVQHELVDVKDRK